MKTIHTPTRIAAALALALAAAQSHAALPPTAAGAVDPTFNAGSVVFDPYGAYFDFGTAVSVQADGKILTGGYGADKSSDDRSSFVRRHNADGSPDHSYASSGMLRLGSATNMRAINSMLIDADGKSLVVGSGRIGNPADNQFAGWIARIDAQGNPDATFGFQGESTPSCAPRAGCYLQSAALQADGRILSVGAGYDAGYKNLQTYVRRANPDGSNDPQYGAGGRMVFPASLAGFEPSGIVLDALGRAIVTGSIAHDAPAVKEGVVVRLLSDGTLDSTFNGSGVLRLQLAGLATDLGEAAVQADGKVVVAGGTYDSKGSDPRYVGRVIRLDAQGTIDFGFGALGIATLDGGFANGVRLQKSGAIVWYGQGFNAVSNNYVAAAGRLAADGKVDTSFGAAGIVKTNPESYTSTHSAGVLGADERVILSGYAERKTEPGNHSMFVRLIGAETTTTVTEFYNTALNHYFITADPNEASAIDNGAAGPGWSRTGIAWKSGGPARVCRFYGSPEVDPATQQRKGPNGHFYTISAEECALVKEDAGWKFESYDFSGWPKQADGTCAAGTVAVKRAYNNRFAMNDSNHRYTTSDAVYQQMVTSGWTGEGAVFCAPQ